MIIQFKKGSALWLISCDFGKVQHQNNLSNEPKGS
ncbi:hypothetical protein BVRB_4g097230 [Beta vulgaris subsp. vulgaris]|uniref:Uncharacterized protein n=1 Tax=Beta vulgaris subsp. vulgaris TaxID=3555 RepID=A0A0J8B9F1_BETVV|nr:hypothetical protein BVRB_4g097230 [Beta vulgaris subsp. vulgaris]